METVKTVGDRKLDDCEIGTIFRRVNEVIKRIDSGAIPKRKALEALQAIVEGKATAMMEPCQRKHCFEHPAFVRPSSKARKKSKSPMKMRLPLQLSRLDIYDKLHILNPGAEYPSKHPEDIMAEMWEAENIPNPQINYGGVPVQAILDEPKPSERDRAIVASTLQWLGTNCGREFLSRFVFESGLHR
jgi:hypothetical protein